MAELARQTHNAVMQLYRYGKGVENADILMLLELLTSINDDAANGRNINSTGLYIQKMHETLNKIEADLLNEDKQ